MMYTTKKKYNAMGAITAKRFEVLLRASYVAGPEMTEQDPAHSGTSIQYEASQGCTKQVRWAISYRLARVKRGRLVITRKGRAVMYGAR